MNAKENAKNVTIIYVEGEKIAVYQIKTAKKHAIYANQISA